MTFTTLVASSLIPATATQAKSKSLSRPLYSTNIYIYSNNSGLCDIDAIDLAPCSITPTVVSGGLDLSLPTFAPWATSVPNSPFGSTIGSTEAQGGKYAAQASIPGFSSGVANPITLTHSVSVCPGTSYALAATCGVAITLTTADAEKNFIFNGGSSGSASISVLAYCTGVNSRTVYIDSVAVTKN
ncbi:hypothetical protein BDZ45DRAFT_748359 [Acephala macrosclerotiorum]|nr:hypothetical protein BDZ45DRAFT_748359 [Acephala macrosclerotiorum]